MIYEEFKEEFGLWAPLFKDFIESKEMDKIYTALKEEGKTTAIAPDSGSTFRVFKSTDPDTIKNIWYLLDPYPKAYKSGLYQATGLM